MRYFGVDEGFWNGVAAVTSLLVKHSAVQEMMFSEERETSGKCFYSTYRRKNKGHVRLCSYRVAIDARLRLRGAGGEGDSGCVSKLYSLVSRPASTFFGFLAKSDGDRE